MNSVNKKYRDTYWTHPSILSLLDEGNPVDVIIERARSIVYDALQKGWVGPPFDPFKLAEILKLKIAARADISDARTVPYDKEQRLLIEFNPNRPKGRIRFSIAHEIAHSLFLDCNEYIRERQAKKDMRGDDWQLEMLCNIAASEILMPIGSFTPLQQQIIYIDDLMKLREHFDVSMEALLLRVTKLSKEKCFAFFCSKKDVLDPNERYRIDYLVPSDASVKTSLYGSKIPKGSHVEECTAIDFTSKGDENWPGLGQIHIECVGIPPYPLYSYPRVAGIANFPTESSPEVGNIKYIKGDATQPRGNDKRIIAFVINDKGLSWGAGFARCLQKKWPFVQQEFKNWAINNKQSFTLGNVHITKIDENLLAFKMICQHGYGPSSFPGIRYEALNVCLNKLAKEATQSNSSVHMPRIGAGEAGGSWEVISELIENNLCKSGVNVTVYDLPNTRKSKSHGQLPLFDSKT